jgi:uncharacterized membrane protein YvlD (DUF360 family)
LFSLVVNALLVGFTTWLSEGFDVHGFWAAFCAAILISIFSTVLGVRSRRLGGSEMVDH